MNAEELLELNIKLEKLLDKKYEIIKQQSDKIVMVTEECIALRKQLIAATSELMEIKRWTLTTFMPYIRAKWAVRKRNEAGIG